MVLPYHVVITKSALGRLTGPGRSSTESAERDQPLQSVERDPDALPRKKSLVELWWTRFLRMTLDDIRQLPSSVQNMMAQDPSATITSLNLHDSPLSADTAHLTSERQQRILSSRIMFMYNMHVADALCIIMHIFFYAVMYHPDPDRWRVDLRSRRRKRIARLSARDIDTLYAHFTRQFPNVAIDRGSFDAQLRDWRRLGSVYVYIAARLGLGSLLYLQEHILPARCWGASKGGEKGGVSERALQHLEKIGLPELCEESGANRCVSGLLGALCHGFGSFDFGDLDVGDGTTLSPDL